MVARPATGAKLPAIELSGPAGSEPRGATVLWVSSQGKSSVMAGPQGLHPDVAKLVAGGATVLAADLLYQGELLPGGRPLDACPVVPDPKPCASLTLGYNRTVVAERAADVLTLLAAAERARPGGRVVLVADAGAAPYAAAAAALADGRLAAVAITTAGFRFAGVPSWRSPDFLPGVVKYGDLPALLALAAPTPLWLGGEAHGAPPVTAAAYSAAGASGRLACPAGAGDTGAAIAFVLDHLAPSDPLTPVE